MDIKILNAIYRSIQQVPVKKVSVRGEGFFLSMTRGGVVPLSMRSGGTPVLDLTEAPKEVGEQKKEQKTTKDVLSPQVGYFSRFNPKTKKQYVKLRDRVEVGDIVGIVSSLKVDHEVASNVEGKIVHFLVEEGQPVEYKQPLARLE